MAVNIQLRRGTAAEWTASNPTLTEGEVGVETDTKKLKVGDGLTVWASLPYINLTPAAAASIYAPIANPTFTGTVSGVTKSMVGLGSVDNTTDANKPVSTATQTALDLKAPLASPALTGTPTAPTATAGTATTQVATTAFVGTAVSNLVASAPGALDTLNELATALGNDASFSTTVTNALAAKAPLASPTFTGTVSLDTGVSLVFEGATANAFETTLAVEDPTADRTLTLPNETGTLATQEWSNSIGLNHTSATTSVHGIADTAQLATKQYADTAAGGAVTTAGTAADTKISTHNSDTTEVHGIADTSVLTTASNTQTLTNKTLTSPKINENVALTATSTALNYVATATSDIQTQLNNKQAVVANVSDTEIGYLDGVTSAIQTQINNKQPIVANVSDVEIGYLDGVTSSIQTQLDDKSTASKTETLTNKTLTSPVINTPTGITKTDVGLANVDNTTDANKPVSTAQQTALNLKANLADPTFTGTVVLPSTTSVGDVSATELGYVNGVTSAIQTQLDDKLSKTGGTMTGAITLSGAPTESLHAATKAYVDSAVEGLHVHPSVKAATTENITLATAVENGDTLDGVTLVTGDRILVKNQTTTSQNGIYIVAASGAPTRATDFDTAAEIDSGDFVFVDQGTTQANSGYVQINTPAIIGTDAIEFVQFSGAGTFLAGSALTLTGNTFSIADGAITSAKIADGTIVDADINASAAIAQSKISGLTSALGDKAPLASPTFTGTVTVAASGIAFTDGTQTKEGVPSRTPIIQKTASYTLSALTERDDLIEMASGSAMTLTIPADSTLDFPIGTSLDILQTSTGQVTVAGAGGVTVNSTPGLKLRTQWSSATLFKRAANTWVVFGDLTA
jgi:hypothetical protein